MLRRSYPILFRILVWIVLPLFFVLAAVYWHLMQSLPGKEGVVFAERINSSVEIFRDVNGIPHVVAKTDEDAFFALGYLHAQDRLWQMVYQRRVGQGRLSEILGGEQLMTDQLMRTLGLYHVARLDFGELNTREKSSLNAYSEGVNFWMQQAKALPIEFYLLNFEPEPWKPEDSLLVIKLLAFSLGFNHIQELTYDLLVKEVGLEKASDLMPDYPVDSTTVIDSSESVSEKVARGLIAQANYLQEEFGLGGEGLGSNAWVVSGEFTQSGKPLLASDPHLATEIPSVWYLAEIKGSKLHVTGATYPGLPVVVFGHNQKIAWGGTALGGDVQDLFLERINPRNENQYEIDGQWKDMHVRTEWIRVKSDFPSFLTDPVPLLEWGVRSTRHGPLISDVIGPVETPLALRWVALDPGDKSFASFLGINYAQNWAEFKQALKEYSVPTMNFIYADQDSNIGYITGGKIPVRGKGDGKLPAIGWQSGYEWVGYLPQNELPQSFNPSKGYIVSANNKNHHENYPYIVSNNWAPPYRAERITEALTKFIQKGEKFQVEHFRELQGDYASVQAVELLQFLGKVTGRTPSQQTALKRLREWDAVMREDSVEAALYQSWLRHFNRSLMMDDLRGDLLNTERLDQFQNFAERLNPLFLKNAIAQESRPNQHRWCDQILTENAETCEDMALAALDAATDELLSLTGNEKQWGDLHRTLYSHRPFSAMQFLDHIFNRKISNGGDSNSINVASWRYSKDSGYQQQMGPSYRQVIDLSDWNNSGFINNTGQSGNIISKHYDDNIEPHKNLELLPMYFGATVKANDWLKLVLQPTQQEAK